jgi:surface protein
MSKDRARLLEQNRIDSLNIWADAQRRALHEAVRNTPISIAEAGIGTGSGGAYDPEPPPPPPLPDGFISTWRTTSPGETITLPYKNDGTYSGTIYWGDDTTSENTYATREHTYATPGDYTIIIEGVITGWVLARTGMAQKLITISKWNNINFGGDYTEYFSGCTELTITATDAPDFTGIFDLTSMFEGCTSLTDIPYISSWATYSVTNMSSMFKNAENFNGDLSGFQVNSVTDMTDMFYGASSFNGDLSGWSVTQLVNARRMFLGASSFEGYGLEGWNTSALQDASYMFAGCSSFNGQIGNWVTSSVTSMGYMLSGATGFVQEALYWDTTNVEDMSGMFQDSLLVRIDLTPNTVVIPEYWNTGNVLTMANMFANGLNKGKGALTGVDEWDVSNVTDMSRMFEGCSKFNEPLGQWFKDSRTSNVTNMNSMFEDCFDFDSDISGWDITGLETAINFMAGKSTADYSYLDDVYITWSNFVRNNNGPSNVTIDFGTIQYSSQASSARQSLTSAGRANWTITDGGEI